MNGGPSQGYLAQLGAALAQNDQARVDGGPVNGLVPPPAALPPMVPAPGGGYPSLGALAQAPPPPPPAPAAGAPPAAPQPWVPQDPLQQGPVTLATDPPGGFVPPTPAGSGGEGGAPGEPSPFPNDVEVRQVGGGKGIPAHEAMNKGPEQLGHYMAAFDREEEAARSQNLRTQLQADREEAMYARQAEAAQAREVAAQAAVARRSEEMRRTDQQFREQVDMLSQQHLDQGRLFANQGTGEKIVTTILLGLGSLGGGPNPVVEAINKKIDRDIDAQKFDYDAGLNRAKGLHSAYGMLMDRYHEEDIALAGARTAALDYALAQVNGMKAQWKGTDSANTLDAIGGKLGADRENTLGNARTLVAATAAGPSYEVSVRDRGGMQKLAGTLTAAEARKVQLDHGVKVNEKTEDEKTKGGLALTMEDRKAQHALEKAQAKGGGQDAVHAYNVDMDFLKNAKRNLVESSGPGRRESIPGATSAHARGMRWAGAGAPDTNAYTISVEATNAQMRAKFLQWMKLTEGRLPSSEQLDHAVKPYLLEPDMWDSEKELRLDKAGQAFAEYAKKKGVANAGSAPEAGTAEPASDLIEEP